MQDKTEYAVDKTGYEYDTLMNALHVSVSKHLLDEHFTVIWANDFYYELIGYQKDEYEAIFHNHCDEYYFNESLGIRDEELWTAIGENVTASLADKQSGYKLITKMRRKNGDYFWVRMVGKFTEEYIDGYQVSYTVMTDVSDVVQLKLEQSATYDNLPGFVAKYRITKNLEFHLIEANKKFIEFFGEDSWKDQDYSLYRQNVARNIDLFIAQKPKLLLCQPVHFPVHMSDCHGNDAWLQLNATCVGHQDGDPVYLVIYIDISNEKELERQADEQRAARLLAEEASRAKSEFFSRMSHDIRTPMNAILGMRDIAEAHIGDTEKVRDCLKKIAHSGQYLMELINNVLDMSKIENGEMAIRNDTMSLPETMENVVSIMQPELKRKNQNFSARLDGVIHEQLFGDALRLRQILINVLGNAGKFTPEGGSITLEIKENKTEDPKKAVFQFFISDNGVGMKPEFVEHIFDAFSREQDSRVDKTEGTGLGMAITKKIVELLGGNIKVESEPQKGSTFCVTLPFAIEEQVRLGPLPNLKILVADDDDIICEHTLETLRKLGIRTERAPSGEEAVNKTKAALKAGQPYDAVILDWKMPGMDGLETTRRLRKIAGTKLPVVILSAYDWSDIRGDAEDAGVSGFLSKPLFVSTLVNCLETYVLKEKRPQTTGEHGKNQFARKRFLLVEDNQLNREVAVELLKDTGAEIDVAVDGAQGVETFKRSQEGYYDMILMDIQMPVMNGYDATRIIRSLNRNDAALPILAMTADAFAEDIRAAKDAGMDGHMSKPLSAAALNREIAKFIL